MIYEELIVLILISAVYAEFALPAVPAADTAGELQHTEVSPIAQKKPCSHHKGLFLKKFYKSCATFRVLAL